MKIQSFKDLKVWQKSHELSLQIYKLTTSFPDSEKFGLVSQVRRSTISVSANIAEGFKRRGPKDKINFYNIAQGSLNELENYVILAKDLKYIERAEKIESLILEISKMLNSLITIISSP